MSPTLPFDPIDEAARHWRDRWDGVTSMRAVTSIMRVQQLLIGQLDELLKPHGLTFARYEALVLLTFSRTGSLPLGRMGERLQVHPTSITSIVQRLVAAGFVRRDPHPTDGRGVLATLTDSGREVVEAATADLVARDFGLGVLDEQALTQLTTLLAPVRRAAGDFS
jgi:DNA-binding MarR family transcriptional regulator